jgi:hypothetical protein
LSGSRDLLISYRASALGQATTAEEGEMTATWFGRSAAAYCAAVALAAMVAVFVLGQARAQPVTPPITLPPPTFNPSTPNTVPQAPPTPVSPRLPSGLGSGAAPVSPAIVSPPSVRPATTPARVSAKRAHMHVRRHREVRVRRRRRHARFHRVLGPSYYPGLGEFYPPSGHPCRFRRVWSGYYAGEWNTYTCSW